MSDKEKLTDEQIKAIKDVKTKQLNNNEIVKK
jgi:hypothetical protein